MSLSIVQLGTARLLALGCVLLFNISVTAKPDNRYADAYRQYLTADDPIEGDGIRHFVYFSRDRAAMHDHPFLKCPNFAGAQIMYAWSELETAEGVYDFSAIETDLEYLASRGKRLFVQLQDATFTNGYRGVPDYLMSDDYDDGTIAQHNDAGEPEGWTAKRWNAQVRARFAALLNALGQTFDGRIEGINLQETALGVSAARDSSFSPENYTDAIKANMLALKQAFPRSVTMQYANFMPGEWLPWDDKGYLRSIYRYGEEIGVGLGAPDLMVRRKAQLNHALAMLHEIEFSVPTGIAVQDGNYIGQTNDDTVLTERESLVPLLHAFAKNFLQVKYMFWSQQEPYCSEDVMPFFATTEPRQ